MSRIMALTATASPAAQAEYQGTLHETCADSFTDTWQVHIASYFVLCTLFIILD